MPHACIALSDAATWGSMYSPSSAEDTEVPLSDDDLVADFSDGEDPLHDDDEWIITCDPPSTSPPVLVQTDEGVEGDEEERDEAYGLRRGDGVVVREEREAA